MEGQPASFQSVLQNIFEEALEKKKKDEKEEYERQMKIVGPNPFIDNPLDCISFLEQCITSAAQRAENSVIIPYADIPALAARMETTKSFPLVAKRDLHVSVIAIQNAFRAAHPEFVSKSHKDTAEILIYGAASFKITF